MLGRFIDWLRSLFRARNKGWFNPFPTREPEQAFLRSLFPHITGSFRKPTPYTFSGREAYVASRARYRRVRVKAPHYSRRRRAYTVTDLIADIWSDAFEEHERNAVRVPPYTKITFPSIS